MAWSNRDLLLFAQGMAVGGKYNVAGMGGYQPKLWNEEGVYGAFYIDFLKPLTPFSFAQFRSSVTVIGNKGLLTILSTEQISSTTVKVFCEISQESYGVSVIGSYKSWLTYETGKPVREFVSSFYVAGLVNYVDLAYVFESLSAVYRTSSALTASIMYPQVQQRTLSDTLAFTSQIEAEETVAVSYVQY